MCIRDRWYNRNEWDEWFDALYTEVPNPMEANNANANTQGMPASAPTSNAESTPPAPNANQPMYFAAMYTQMQADIPHNYGTRNAQTTDDPTICSMLFAILMIWIKATRDTASSCYKITSKIARATAKLIPFVPAF
eukprot:2096126-Rhodomonas_salina.1